MVLGVAVGGEVMVEGVNCAGVLLVGGGVMVAEANCAGVLLVGGGVMVAEANCAGVLLVGGWDSVWIPFSIPRTATNSSSAVTSTGNGKVMLLLLGAARWPKKHEHRGHTDATLATFWPHSAHSMSRIRP